MTKAKHVLRNNNKTNQRLPKRSFEIKCPRQSQWSPFITRKSHPTIRIPPSERRGRSSPISSTKTPTKLVGRFKSYATRDQHGFNWQSWVSEDSSLSATSRSWEFRLPKLADPQTHWHSSAPPGVINPGSMFETHASIQGAQCAS